jgi:hypothetical protein
MASIACLPRLWWAVSRVYLPVRAQCTHASFSSTRNPVSSNPATSLAAMFSRADWHRQAGRWDPPVIRQNRVPASREMDGDMLLVGVENQAVWLWGVRDRGGNPLVWERENEPGAGWTETRLSRMPAPTRSSSAPARTRTLSKLTTPTSRGTGTRATNCKCQPQHDQPPGGQ